MVSFQWLKVARRGFLWLFVAFCGFFVAQSGCALRCLLRCLSQTMFMTWYPLQNQSRPRPRPRLTTDCPTFRTGTAATTHGCRDCHGCNRDDDQRSSSRLRLSHLMYLLLLMKAPVKSQQHNPRLHHMSAGSINGTVGVFGFFCEPRWVCSNFL